MTLKEISHGPSFIIWIVFAFIVVISIILLSGHGVNLIAGYNTASEEEKKKFDQKKLCRIIGAGMLVIAVLLFVMAIAESVLPASFAYWMLGIIAVDCVVMVILANTICKKS